MRRFLLLALVGFFGMTQINCGTKSSPSSPSNAGNSFNFLLNIGEAGNGAPPTFGEALGVAAVDGKIYAGDFLLAPAMYISVFDESGNLLSYFTPFNTYGDPILAGGMKADKFGHLYTSDLNDKTVNCFNLNSIPATAAGQPVTAAFTYNAD